MAAECLCVSPSWGWPSLGFGPFRTLFLTTQGMTAGCDPGYDAWLNPHKAVTAAHAQKKRDAYRMDAIRYGAIPCPASAVLNPNMLLSPPTEGRLSVV